MIRSTSRHPLWIPVRDEAAAAWCHYPTEGPSGPGVLICPSLGHEYTHAHRSILHLATALAEQGLIALRIDYPGTGDSTGDELTPGLFDLWLEAIDAAADRLESLTDGRPVTLVGLRLGTSVAAVAATRRAVQHLVAWNPIVDGRRYVRELTALHRISREAEEEVPPVLDAGGFQMSPEVADAISELNLLRDDYRIGGEALVVERGDVEADGRLAACFTDLGIPTSTMSQFDYLDMVAEPQYAVVPSEVIEGIVEWIAERSDRDSVTESSGPPRDLRANRIVRIGGRSEELVTVTLDGSSRLSGVLSVPEADHLGGGTAVVVPNSGSVHHVGPHRIWVELGRSLAERGVASFRFDLRNLGDSVYGACPDENHPYPATAVQDVERALEWLAFERGFESFVIAGLCSGAHTAFHAGVELPSKRIKGVISVNPLAFYWEEGMSLDTPSGHQTSRDASYYRQAIRDGSRWIRVIRGRSDMGQILRFVVKRCYQMASYPAAYVLDRIGLSKEHRLETDLGRLQRHNRPILFVFSSTDPGYAMLLSEARATLGNLVRIGAVDLAFVSDADHTFSKKPWRDEAIRAIVDRVAQWDLERETEEAHATSP